MKSVAGLGQYCPPSIDGARVEWAIQAIDPYLALVCLGDEMPPVVVLSREVAHRGLLLDALDWVLRQIAARPSGLYYWSPG